MTDIDIDHAHNHLLEQLDDMALLTFDQAQEAAMINDHAYGTPTTDTMSLPTPLQMELKALPRMETEHPCDGCLPPSLSAAPNDIDVLRSPLLGELQCPGAPMITDMDSFGEGSEEGDFADLLSASRMSDPDRAITQSNVHLIPRHDVVRRIQEWQSEVESGKGDTSAPDAPKPQERATAGPWPATKRPRSVESGEEEIPRTRRARIPKAAPRSVVQFCAPPGEQGVEDECQAEAPD
ncbi:hypothetical protein BD626DRAFT_272818 [Schizophyllum amplum]|uniref:Uncharacterized protein n=1 Tax=Schizophyllum amplum TaxID=97359 RepID=A0A550CFR1_9AGAR|nr:hypothetical protein BD626DRAFT_272818 [Auriculariopsis ampla]